MSPPPSSTFRTPRVRKPTIPPKPNSNHAPLFLSDHTLYGSARLGQRQQNKIVNQSYVPPGTHNLVGVTYVQRGWKAYELSNHLGNVLSVISDRKEAGHCNDTLVAFYYPDIIQNNDYYPFGSPMEGRGQQSKNYRYGFNGKEHDSEGLGGGGATYDYGFRIYNPAISKFLSVDPIADQFPAWSPYVAFNDNPIYFIDPDGRSATPPDNHYINRDGSIYTVKTDDDFDRFYTQNSIFEGGYTLEATISKNDKGLVLFPERGNGFERYGIVDRGGQSTNPPEAVGKGDHYLKPETAAALFGVINELRGMGITIALGDMSSSNGSDPWQTGQIHHSGHGHLGKRSGLDVDFRYINHSGVSFQSSTATSSSSFSVPNNTAVYDAANRFGFTRNYQGVAGVLPKIAKVKGHDDHGHLGLDYRNLNWLYSATAPKNPSLLELNTPSWLD